MGANQNPLSFLSQAGMGDFGLTQDSQTNSLSAGSQDGANVPDLQQLLSSSILDAEEKARMAGQQMDAIRGQETEGVSGRLFGKQGALIAALAAGAGIFGNPAMALGVAGSGVQGLQEQEAAERTALKEAHAQAAAERDAALDRADKERNRMANMFNTNPEAFVDPKTGEPVADPVTLGYLFTGTNLPVHPTTRRVMQTRTEDHKATTTMLLDALENSKGIPQARQITNQLFTHLNDEGNIPGTVKDAIVETYGTPEFEREFANTVFRYGGQSALDAAIEAGRRGVPLHDPEILDMMDFSQGDVLVPSQKVTEKFIKLSNVVREYQKNPANAEIVTGLRAQAEDTPAFYRALVERALPLAADQIDYFKGAGMMRDISFDQWQTQFNDARDKYSLVDTIGGAQALGDLLDLPPEERDKRLNDLAAGTAQQTHQKQVEESRTLGANQMTSAISKGAADIVSTYVVSEPWAGQKAEELFREAKAEAGQGAQMDAILAIYQEKLNAFLED